MTKVTRNVRSTRKEVKQDFEVCRMIVRCSKDVLENTDFNNYRNVAPLLALAFEESQPRRNGLRTLVAHKFGYRSYQAYVRTITNLS